MFVILGQYNPKVNRSIRHNICMNNDTYMTHVRLKKLRAKKGYTQIKVQLQTGIDQSDYSKIEKGTRYPTVEQAKRLAVLFETSTDYIFGLTNEERPYPRR